jgi:hypothetical protein
VNPITSQGRLTHDLGIHPHLLVPRVDHQVRPGGRVQPTAAELRKLLVQFRGHPADRGRRDLRRAHRVQHLTNVARAHALKVHLGACRQQRPLAPLPPVEEARVVRLATTHLRDRQFEFAHPRLEPPRFASIAIPGTLISSLVPIGAEVLAHLDRHRLLDHRFQKSLQPVLLGEQRLQ